MLFNDEKRRGPEINWTCELTTWIVHHWDQWYTSYPVGQIAIL